MAKDIPIIFSAAMVRALIEGRKTQTRRILKPQPVPFKVDGGLECEIALEQLECDPRPRIRLGRVITTQEVRFAVGDRLWVRENWAPLDRLQHSDPGTLALAAGGFYQADGSTNPGEISKWTPSIHMPRTASRITLMVTGVKVERLTAISDEDAKAEGIAWCNKFEWWHCDPNRDGAGPGHGRSPADAFLGLWSMLHGPESEAANPFVVAITFRVIKANIDAPEARAAA